MTHPHQPPGEPEPTARDRTANPLTAQAEKAGPQDEGSGEGEGRPCRATAGPPTSIPPGGPPGPAAVARPLAAIRERFREDWHRSPQALAVASALWGGGHDAQGVFTDGEQEAVARSGRADAAVTVARSPAGLFAFGVRFSSPTFGFGHAPTVWRRPYATREEARRAAIADLLAGLDEGMGAGVETRCVREDYRRIRGQLLSQLRAAQRGLFD